MKREFLTKHLIKSKVLSNTLVYRLFLLQCGPKKMLKRIMKCVIRILFWWMQHQAFPWETKRRFFILRTCFKAETQRLKYILEILAYIPDQRLLAFMSFLKREQVLYGNNVRFRLTTAPCDLSWSLLHSLTIYLNNESFEGLTES